MNLQCICDENDQFAATENKEYEILTVYMFYQ